MLDWRGVELMCSILTRDMDVLEYGSGGSTTFFRWVEIWLNLVLDLGNMYVFCHSTSFSASLWEVGQASSMIATGSQRWAEDSCATSFFHIMSMVSFVSCTRYQINEGAWHTEEIAVGGPSDIIFGSSRQAVRVQRGLGWGWGHRRGI